MNERANERYARFVESPFVINCRNDNSDQKKNGLFWPRTNAARIFQQSHGNPEKWWWDLIESNQIYETKYFTRFLWKREREKEVSISKNEYKKMLTTRIDRHSLFFWFVASSSSSTSTFINIVYNYGKHQSNIIGSLNNFGIKQFSTSLPLYHQKTKKKKKKQKKQRKWLYRIGSIVYEVTYVSASMENWFINRDGIYTHTHT